MRFRFVAAILALPLGAGSVFGQSAHCPPKQHVTYIQAGRPGDANDNATAAAQVMQAVSVADSLVLLAPDVDIDFSQVPMPTNNPDSAIIQFNRCVTLASYKPEPIAIPSTAASSPPNAAGTSKGFAPALTAIGLQPVPGSGRTPHSPGPVRRYNHLGPEVVLIELQCDTGPMPGESGDGARILGFRIFTGDFGDHFTGERGINISGCHDVEIANMEIAGWANAAIQVGDAFHFPGIPTAEPSEILVRIHDNYIHNNQRSSSQNQSFGYGVSLITGAFAEVDQNVFDLNKHSITANGDAGGYHAIRNLILKGGGYQNGFFERDLHVVDVHGTDNCPGFLPTTGGFWGGVGIGWVIGGPIGGFLGGLYGIGADALQHVFNCGDAGFKFVIEDNAFQYNKTTDLKIRGKPKGQVIIRGNIFARGQDDAIDLYTQDNALVSSSNQYSTDTFGQYGVCDIDGDGIDDLVLMTGRSWWFSSGGKYPWSFLKADTALLKDVRLGDVDGDGHCDIVKDGGNGNWLVSSGGTAEWKQYGEFLAPLSEVQFGRFDPASPDLDRGIRPPTHAFWRAVGGNWFVTPLSQPHAWTLVQSSNFPLANLRFGDFTGDGVTDVLANEGGHWAISNAARAPWKTLNTFLDDPVNGTNIFIANMNTGLNVDDVLYLEVPQIPVSGETVVAAIWHRSFNGTTPWRDWKTYGFTVNGNASEDYVSLGTAFVGQFASGPGATALTVAPDRIGHFYSPAQGKQREGWLSLFPY